MHPPDFEAWASTEALSCHEVACLCVGIEPSALEKPPSIPEGIETDVTQEEVDSQYRRIKLVLERAAAEKRLETTFSGRINPAQAMQHLYAVAKAKGWSNWFSGCDFLSVIQRAQRTENAGTDSPEEILNKKIAELEAEITLLKIRQSYSTPMLEAVYRVIDEHYAGKSSYPKQHTAFSFLDEHPLSNGAKWSDKKKSAIWAVASHPSQEKGGLKTLDKKIKRA